MGKEGNSLHDVLTSGWLGGKTGLKGDARPHCRAGYRDLILYSCVDVSS